MNLKDSIRTVLDFPKPGIGFKDITTLLENPAAFRVCLNQLRELNPKDQYDRILGIEARGFIFGAALANLENKPLVLARKPGKLPWKTVSRTYDLEYGSDTIEIHSDSIKAGERILIIDDLLATGGTMEATALLVRDLGATVNACCCVIELDFLGGRQKLESAGFSSRNLLVYSSEEE
jgi:adenine phosphoribosyltransferase